MTTVMMTTEEVHEEARQMSLLLKNSRIHSYSRWISWHLPILENSISLVIECTYFNVT